MSSRYVHKVEALPFICELDRAEGVNGDMEHYCHNCGHWSRLADRVHCGYCLAFFYWHARMPRLGE